MSKTSTTIEFILPDLGEGLAEATISKWLVESGSEINIDQEIVLVETAKSIVSIPAPYPGKLTAIMAPAGTTVLVGSPLCVFEASISDTPINNTNNHQTPTNIPPRQTKYHPPTNTSIKASPRARQLASQYNIDLTKITPNGPRNSITVAAIQQAITAKPPSQPPQRLSSGHRAMAYNLENNSRDIVQSTIMDEIILRHSLNPKTVLTKTIRALEYGITQVPQINGHFQQKTYQVKRMQNLHLGLAVASQSELFLPVITNTQDLSDAQLRTQIQEYKHQATTDNFSPDQLTGFSLILTNIGSLGIKYGTPVVISPCICSVAIGKLDNKLIQTPTGTIKNIPILPISISFDHRVITGAEAAAFMHAIGEYFQKATV